MNLHAVLNFLAAILLLTMGLFATLRNRKSKVNFSFFLLTLSAFIWQFGTGLAVQAKDPYFALTATRIASVGVYLIPVMSYYLSLCILGINRNKILIFGYISVFLFFIPVGWTSLLILNGVYKYPWGFFFKAGYLHPLFMVFFICFMLLVFYNLFLSYKKESNPLEKNRKKYFFVALFVAYIGSIDFLPTYGIQVYPFGYVAIICCFLIFVYAIQRYNLMDVRVAITRATVFIMVYGAVLTVPFIFGLSVRSYLLSKAGIYWWLIPVCLMGLLASAGPFIYTYIQRKMENKIFKKQRQYQKALRQLSAEMTRIKNLSRLLDLTVIQIVRIVRVTHASMFLYNKDINKYVLKASRGKSKKEIGVELKPNNILVKSLFKIRSPVIYDELDGYIRKADTSIKAPDIKELRLLMKQLDAAVCIPGFIEDRLIVILILGEKQSAEIYTQEDLDAFTTLINQTALAIDDAQAYEELMDTKDQLIKVEKLAAMGEFATEVAHEIKNPLQAIKAFTELINEKYNDKNFREKFSKLVKGEVERIDNFVRQLIRVAHPLPPQFGLVEINEVLNSVLELMDNDLTNNDILVKKQYEINLTRIKADKNQLKQVFLNIIANAIDAMKNSKNRVLTVSTSSSNSQAIIKITDTGCGIPPDSIPRLFNPLFTTKERGSGLGLSIVDTIIKNHQGKIDVESKVGGGTSFIITI